MPHREIVDNLIGECTGEYCTLAEILKVLNQTIPKHNPDYGHCQNKECPLKERVLESGLSDRLLEQFKAIEIYKLKKGIPCWDEALRSWSHEGYAEAFSEIYNETIKKGDEIDHHMIYDETEARVNSLHAKVA